MRSIPFYQRPSRLDDSIIVPVNNSCCALAAFWWVLGQSRPSGVTASGSSNECLGHLRGRKGIASGNLNENCRSSSRSGVRSGNMTNLGHVVNQLRQWCSGTCLLHYSWISANPRFRGEVSKGEPSYVLSDRCRSSP